MEAQKNKFIERFVPGDRITPLHSRRMNQIIDRINWLIQIISNITGRNGIQCKISDSNLVISLDEKILDGKDSRSDMQVSGGTGNVENVYITNNYCNCRYI